MAQWYRRAYFDDGTPLGSSSNAECQIDSIAAELVGAVRRRRPAIARQTAMESLDRHLVDREHRLIQLLDPPFDKSPLDPGYIKGYVPGVRENGGQYTHAAIWASMAFAALGDAERANELLGFINPIKHASSAQAVDIYKVEPYVVAADVYAVAPHTGRGGWTWYTGSAGWMYRLMTESILGLRLDGDKLHIAPCVPDDWAGYKITYTHGDTRYDFTISRSQDAQLARHRRWHGTIRWHDYARARRQDACSCSDSCRRIKSMTGRITEDQGRHHESENRSARRQTGAGYRRWSTCTNCSPPMSI